MRAPLPRTSRWRTPLALFSLLALALAVRLPLMPTTAHLAGIYSDASLWKAWIREIHQHGLVRIFDVSDINYIGYDYALWLIAAVYQHISPSFDVYSMRLHLLIKGPPVLFDLALVALTFVVSRDLLRRRPDSVEALCRRFPVFGRQALPPESALALVPAAVVALEPAIIYDSAAWGQTDSIITFFMLGAALAMARRAPATALFLWTVGFVVKPQPIVMLPPLAAFAWWVYGWRGLVKAFGGMVAGLAVTLGFWVAHGEIRSLVHVYHMLFTPEPTLSMQAWNTWWFSTVHSHPVPGDTAFAVAGRDVSYKLLSLALFAAATALALGYLRRHRDLVGLLEASAFMVFAFFMLPVSIHERYLYPWFGLIAPLLLVRPRWLLLFVPLSVTFFLNLFIVAPLAESLTGRWTDSYLSLAVAAAHVAMFLVLILAFARGSLPLWRTNRAPQPAGGDLGIGSGPVPVWLVEGQTATPARGLTDGDGRVGAPDTQPAEAEKEPGVTRT